MKPVKTTGIKRENEPFKVVNSDQFKKDLNSLPKGGYDIIVSKRKIKASVSQFSYLYGLVYPLSLIALNNAGYEFTSEDNYRDVDNFWKLNFANKEVLNRETGELIKMPQNKREFMTIDEMVYCNLIRDYCAEWFHTFIPDPDPNWKQNKT